MIILEHSFGKGACNFQNKKKLSLKAKGTFTGSGSQGRFQTRESQ